MEAGSYMAVVGLGQVWHNDLCVAFGSHGPRVQERFLIGYAAAVSGSKMSALHDLDTHVHSNPPSVKQYTEDVLLLAPPPLTCQRTGGPPRGRVP